MACTVTNRRLDSNDWVSGKVALHTYISSVVLEAGKVWYIWVMVQKHERAEKISE